MINLYIIKIYIINKLISSDCNIGKLKNIIFFFKNLLLFSLNMIKIYKNLILEDYYSPSKIWKTLKVLGGIVRCLLRYISSENWVRSTEISELYISQIWNLRECQNWHNFQSWRLWNLRANLEILNPVYNQL